MRRTLSSLFVFILIACPSSAARSRTSAQAGQSEAAQSPDLAEAERLTREVVQLFKAGKLELALPPAERVVALREKALGLDHVEVAKSLSNVATILNQLGKYDRARVAYLRALPILESKLGPDDALTNQTREDLAGVYFREGNAKSAEPLLMAALSSREKSPGAEHEQIIRTLVGLAYVYIALHDYEKREATVRRLLDAAESKPEALKAASRLFGEYLCTGATRLHAPAEQKQSLKRIVRLWSTQKGISLDAAGGEDVLQGRATYMPAPDYPALARSARAQGPVVVFITTDESGKVMEAEPVCGPDLLRGVSAGTARQWTFQPPLVNGLPVKFGGTITFNFTLQ